MNSRRLLIATMSVLPFAGCGSSFGTMNFLPADAYKGENNLKQALTPTVVRVSTYQLPGISPGACATLNAEPVAESCLKDGVSAPALDKAVRPDLSESGFRYFSKQTSTAAQVHAAVGTGSGDASVTVQKYQLIIEWARWRQQSLPLSTFKAGRPVIQSIDIGVAVRIIFDVAFTNADAKLTANLGMAAIATALATNSATVLVSYDTAGTTVNLLPQTPPTSITTVDSFIQAVNAFYGAVQRLSVAYESYARKKGVKTSANTAVNAPPDGGPKKDAAILSPQVPDLADDESAFDLDSIAYYVSNLPDAATLDNASFAAGYLYGLDKISKGASCGQAAAERKSNASFLAGQERAYSDVVSLSTCDNSKPSDTQIGAAKQNLGRVQ